MGKPLAIFCGPCVIESRDHLLRHAELITAEARKAKMPLVFKSSFDKANRTSAGSFRGVGMQEGLAILSEVRREFGVPVVTDVHDEQQVEEVAKVCDVLQIPAFLCRQTDLVMAAARTGKPLLIKKGQFLAPEDMQYVAEKAVVAGGADRVMLCERGTCFGYRDLVVDFRGLHVMRSLGYPVVFDATHSVQSMGGAGGSSSGKREYVPLLTRAAVAVGVDALFLECHENPDCAMSDGPNMIPISKLSSLLDVVTKLDEVRRFCSNE
ncbi:MAG: 3-deoxy-8-phosphooctulonate synthase [Deltaproteobacteria bacterium]|nr:3-deoxy-8-phosphooctulonate synthase [Deltaproteobacteria bacterium]